MGVGTRGVKSSMIWGRGRGGGGGGVMVRGPQGRSRGVET